MRPPTDRPEAIATDARPINPRPGSHQRHLNLGVGGRDRHRAVFGDLTMSVGSLPIAGSAAVARQIQ
ncbi:MAG TPA: hypothetical protein VNF73_03445 [Candidatus Saccharimonadales bacterium]|nr:hypothetical protein [Candidatus Saccharimonadales bacterium]